jgi:hypothetical protein
MPVDYGHSLNVRPVDMPDGCFTRFRVFQNGLCSIYRPSIRKRQHSIRRVVSDEREAHCGIAIRFLRASPFLRCCVV